MRRSLRLTVPLLAWFVSLPAGAQEPAGMRTVDEFRRSVPQAMARMALQVRVRWTTDAPSADAAKTANHFHLISARSVRVSIRPERAPEIGPATLLIASVTDDDREVDWRLVPDPRIVRAELGDDAQLRSKRLYYLDIEFVALLPQLERVTQLRVYGVQRAKVGLIATPLGAVNLGDAR
jgi:hypothetical protein